jgi:hypothetical protein
MWLRASLAQEMIQMNPDYVKNLKTLPLFPCPSIYQIGLDIHRLQFEQADPGSFDEVVMRKMGEDLLINYTKRNSIYFYIQSQGPFCSKIT